MISFELTGPLTLETFSDRTDNGSRGGRAEPGTTTEKDARMGCN